VTDIFNFHQGNLPVLISIPHLGTEIPTVIADQMTDEGRLIADTDWHLDRFYDFAIRAGASVLGAKISRYVIDLNRPATGESLYPGQTTTGLCPAETFRGEPLYRNGRVPSDDEMKHRLEKYWAPYHAKLSSELDAMRAKFGTVLLWEAHSIASVLPRLFDGKLPDLNVGTNSGESCKPAVLNAISAELENQPFSWVTNGRFKGGYITRAYGRPDAGIQAVQLEMCQSTYMNENAPFDYRPDLAAKIQPVVERMVAAAARATAAGTL
jgi:N-formylglutamate deformylase